MPDPRGPCAVQKRLGNFFGGSVDESRATITDYEGFAICLLMRRAGAPPPATSIYLQSCRWGLVAGLGEAGTEQRVCSSAFRRRRSKSPLAARRLMLGGRARCHDLHAYAREIGETRTATRTESEWAFKSSSVLVAVLVIRNRSAVCSLRSSPKL